MEKSASQTVQEIENTEVECKTLRKKAGGSGRRKPSRVDSNVTEKSVASGCNTSQTVQEDENTEVECKTLIKRLVEEEE